MESVDRNAVFNKEGGYFIQRHRVILNKYFTIKFGILKTCRGIRQHTAHIVHLHVALVLILSCCKVVNWGRGGVVYYSFV